MRSLAGPSMCDLVGESVMRSQLALCRPFVEQSSRSKVRLDKHAPTITYTLARNHPLSDHRVSRLLDLANPERTSMIAVTHNSSFESDPRSRWAKLSIPSATNLSASEA